MPDGVAVVQALGQRGHDAPVRAVVVHFYFLANNPLLLGNGRLGKIGFPHHRQQDIQALVHLLGGGEQVAGLVKAGVCVGRGPGLCVFCKGVAVLALEHLVLQKVRDARGQMHRLAVHLKIQINGPKTGAVNGVYPAVARHGPHQHGKPAVQLYGFAGGGPPHGLHGVILHGARPPLR